MKLLSPELWLVQAKADEAASCANELSDCHRRYFLQQTYEKAVKALALACLPKKKAKDKQFTSALGDYFLHHHTPLTVFSRTDDTEWEEELRQAYGRSSAAVLKELKALRTMVASAMRSNADTKIVEAWKKIDATRPTRSLNDVSYRYPFVVQKSHPYGVAPATWKGWDDYQGLEGTVRSAISELLVRAGRQVNIWTKST